MCQRNLFTKDSCTQSEDEQLRAEEIWMADALKLIKQQRNTHEVERMQVENQRERMQNLNLRDCTKERAQSGEQENRERAAPSTSRTQQPPPSRPIEHMSIVDWMSQGSYRHGDDMDMDDDIKCNTEELNLDPKFVGPCSSMSAPTGNFKDDLSDEDTSSEASEVDKIIVDINMMMNTNTNNKRN